MKDSLSVREERFVAEYLIDQNGAAAAARAGYSAQSSRYTARDLMKKPLVREQVRMELQALLSGVKASAVEVMRERARGAFFKTSKMLGPGWKLRAWEEMDEETRECLQIAVVQRKYGEEVRIKQPNREKALLALEKVHERLERLNERQWDEELREEKAEREAEREAAREREMREAAREEEARVEREAAEARAAQARRPPPVFDMARAFPRLVPAEGWEAYFEKGRQRQAGLVPVVADGLAPADARGQAAVERADAAGDVPGGVPGNAAGKAAGSAVAGGAAVGAQGGGEDGEVSGAAGGVVSGAVGGVVSGVVVDAMSGVASAGTDAGAGAAGGAARGAVGSAASGAAGGAVGSVGSGVPGGTAGGVAGGAASGAGGGAASGAGGDGAGDGASGMVAGARGCAASEIVAGAGATGGVRTDVFAHVREAMARGVKPADMWKYRPGAAAQAGAGAGALAERASAAQGVAEKTAKCGGLWGAAPGGARPAAQAGGQVTPQAAPQENAGAGARAYEDMPDSLIEHLARVNAGHLDYYAQREIERKHGRLGTRPGDRRPPGVDLGYNPPHLRRDRRDYAIGAGECSFDGYGGEGDG